MKPILFNTENVRAILEGKKFVTRRAIKPLPSGNQYSLGNDSCWPGYFKIDGTFQAIEPPYQPGDILWVREKFDNIPVSLGGHTRLSGRYYYAADGDLRPQGWQGAWKPSIHMPKEAARLFLQVLNVRAERLQEITNEQIEREGVVPQRPKGLPGDGCKCSGYEEGCMDGVCPNRDAYERLCHYTPFMKVWDNTIKKADLPLYGWNANPWVWVIEFERITKVVEEKGGAE
jgi:hypothetical protein